VVTLDVAGAAGTAPAPARAAAPATPSVAALQEQLRLAEQRLKDLEDLRRGSAK
jgi:hypothetical protein